MELISVFLQEITGKSFYIIFTCLNIFLLNSEKLMISIISNLKYHADRKFKSSSTIYSVMFVCLEKFVSAHFAYKSVVQYIKSYYQTFLAREVGRFASDTFGKK